MAARWCWKRRMRSARWECMCGDSYWLLAFSKKQRQQQSKVQGFVPRRAPPPQRASLVGDPGYALARDDKPKCIDPSTARLRRSAQDDPSIKRASMVGTGI